MGVPPTTVWRLGFEKIGMLSSIQGLKASCLNCLESNGWFPKWTPITSKLQVGLFPGKLVSLIKTISNIYHPNMCYTHSPYISPSAFFNGSTWVTIDLLYNTLVQIIYCTLSNLDLYIYDTLNVSSLMYQANKSQNKNLIGVLYRSN